MVEAPSRRSSWRKGATNDPTRISELQRSNQSITSHLDSEGVRSILAGDTDANLFLQIIDHYKEMDKSTLRKRASSK